LGTVAWLGPFYGSRFTTLRLLERVPAKAVVPELVDHDRAASVEGLWSPDPLYSQASDRAQQKTGRHKHDAAK
jgi:hypothetical protein